jgi:hypothetical protein
VHKELPIEETVPELAGVKNILRGIETTGYPVLEETIAATLKKLPL